MSFTFRKFDPKKDIPTMQQWLKDREEPEDVAMQFMPPTGVVVELEGKPICLGFMIRCDNGMCINSDLISDVKVERFVRNEAVLFLRSVLYKIAREQGFHFVTVFTRHEKLQERLKGLGYMEIDSNLTQLGRALWP